MLDRLNETIVAASSAPGHGSVGIVRLSGGRAIDVAALLAAPGSALFSGNGGTRFEVDVDVGDGTCLPATIYLFRGPRSYTREDLVEIHTVGSPAAMELVRRRAVEFGAVPAEAGEFTARAFLNGRMGLGEAESVAAVIRAQTDTQLQASRRMMEGQLAAELQESRTELAALMALVEADIDFAEEPIDFITPAVLGERLTRIAGQLERLQRGAVVLEQIETLPQILLFGPPNAGKSSLTNLLTGTSRAICAAAAGTTRDILSAPVRLGRGDAMLLDAAGIDLSEDDIVTQARDRTVAVAATVDVVCLVIDASQGIDEHVLEVADRLGVCKRVVAANKTDLISRAECDSIVQSLIGRGLGPVCLTSALDGRGIDRLRRALSDVVGSGATTALGGSLLISERQRRAVARGADAIDRALGLCETVGETIDCADLVAVELREALDALGTVTGEVTTDDLLGQVFANFCIGK